MNYSYELNSIVIFGGVNENIQQNIFSDLFVL